MNLLIVRIGVVVVLCSVFTWAQETPYEVTVQGSGFFSKETTGSGITSKPTNSAGILVGFRFNSTQWLAFDADYDHFRNSQKFAATTTDLTSVKTSMHAITGSAVFKIPLATLLKPYAILGVAMMIFEPQGMNFLSDQTRAGFVYGGGIDVSLHRRLALRCQYRGFIYNVPDFGVNTLRVDRHTHTAAPSAGLVITF
jgi:opacity protein-like surface antigen